MKLIYWHGWGYNSTFFQPLSTLLCDFDQTFVDEGFFGAQQIPAINQNEYVGIGHSQGFSRLVQTYPNLKAYISLSGFTQFLKSDSFPEGVLRASLGAMIQQFQRYPDRVLQTFYDRAGFSGPSTSTNRQDQNLLQNLSALKSLKIDLPSKPILAIAGDSDLITPASMQAASFKNIVMLDQAQHCYIHSHGQVTAQSIRQFIRELDR